MNTSIVRIHDRKLLQESNSTARQPYRAPNHVIDLRYYSSYYKLHDHGVFGGSWREF